MRALCAAVAALALCAGAAATVAWPQTDRLVHADALADDDFAQSVAISGDTIVIGEPDARTAAGVHLGLAHVFAYNGTAWNPFAELTGTRRFSEFGWSVAISGNTIVVGAYNYDTGHTRAGGGGSA